MINEEQKEQMILTLIKNVEKYFGSNCLLSEVLPDIVGIASYKMEKHKINHSIVFVRITTAWIMEIDTTIQCIKIDCKVNDVFFFVRDIMKDKGTEIKGDNTLELGILFLLLKRSN